MDILEPRPFVIGLDLGGTNSVFGIVDQRGQVIATNSIKTQTYKTVEDFVDAGVEALKPIIAKVGGLPKSRPWASVRLTATSTVAQ